MRIERVSVADLSINEIIPLLSKTARAEAWIMAYQRKYPALPPPTPRQIAQGCGVTEPTASRALGIMGLNEKNMGG